ncbi:hypothetical protein [Myxococcus sp. CA039A]|uniref:hypothetical protein n=1 Tax=Myxococcus sp. CA039A TaxID=2741737 RepID=UPI00157B009E|nr:hypothetical protein [Myxococcus sp. CA039A]NTX52560.1 hypothetical protein [Myxococcus sp. CA039A]
MTSRRRIAGAVLALALIGALSAGVASGVERARGRLRKPPEPRPPFSQRDDVPLSGPTHGDEASRLATRTRVAPVSASRSVSAVRMSTASPSKGKSGGAGLVRDAVHRVHPRGVAVGDEHTEESSDDSAATALSGGSLAGLTTRVPAPMRVNWRVVDAEGGGLRLVAEVERRAGFNVPIAVSIVLPPEARLIEGTTDFVLPEGEGEDVRAVPCVVSVTPGVVPRTDLVLVAHAEGSAFGAHAEARYTFGRQHLVERRPSPTGPVLPARFLSGDVSGDSEDSGEDAAP